MRCVLLASEYEGSCTSVTLHAILGSWRRKHASSETIAAYADTLSESFDSDNDTFHDYCASMRAID